MKYGKLNLGQIEALVNKLGGIDGVNKFLRGELIVTEPTRSWIEKDGVIYFTIISDGATGEEWISRLESNSCRVSDYAKSILRSKDFKPTSGIISEIAALKGEIFSDNKRITKNIRKEAKKRNLSIPNAEVACLIIEKFSDKELKDMGLHWLVTMHEPIKDSYGYPSFLDAYYDNCGSWLSSHYVSPGNEWLRGGGFAFVASSQEVSGS